MPCGMPAVHPKGGDTGRGALGSNIHLPEAVRCIPALRVTRWKGARLGDVSPNTSSLAVLPPLKDVVFPSLSVESLDVTLDFTGPLKPNFSFLSNLQVQRCPRRENLWSFFISVVP